jgi:FKBP-type peptidyl-prolyl cis-trans isomerase FklB
LIFVSCSGSTEEPIVEHGSNSKIEFNDFTEKISYCIGLDHAFAAYTIYGSQENKSKFDIRQVEAGMVDYLAGNPLRIPFESRDSIFELYLLPDGSVNEEAISRTDASYAVGMEEGYVLVGSLVGRGIDQIVYVDLLIRGVQDGMQASEPAVPLVEARTEVVNYYTKLNLENGELFMAENAQRDSVITTESGLQYTVFKEGTGLKPNLTDTVIVHYTGRFIDGREFESTVPSQRPAVMTPLGLIPGWQEGLLLMREGSRYRLFVPHELGYGEKGSGPIEPYSALVFDIELIKVKRFK